jgi:hypothetical protein
MPQPRLDRIEFSRRGHELYERIGPQVEESHRGKVLAIDIETGAFEVASDTLAATRQLRAHHPDAHTWCVRVGSQELFRMGHYAQSKTA